MDFAIETHDLAKTYGVSATRQPATDSTLPSDQPAGGVQAVRGVNLRIAPGEIYALLGPNGAGKTTTISMLTTLLLPSRGRASVAGYDVVQQPAEVRRRIGVTFQEVVLDQDLTGRQVLDFHGSLYGMARKSRRARIEELGALVELTDTLDRKASRYSGGMKRRLELARGLMTEPAVLFLDEPTQGLDPQNRAGIWRYIRALRERTGMTLLLTTHYMEEAESLADRVGIIDGGLMVIEGSPVALVREMGADLVDIAGEGDAAGFERRLGLLPYVQHTTQPAPANGVSRLQVGVDDGDRRLAELVNVAAAANFHIQEISVARPSLSEVFFAHTGHDLRDRVEE